MDSDRDAEDSHARRGHVPKLSLVGRLDGTLDGRLVTFVADGESATLRFTSLLGALSLGRCWPNIRSLLRGLVPSGFAVRVKLPGLPTATVFPRPSLFARLFMPAR